MSAAGAPVPAGAPPRRRPSRRRILADAFIKAGFWSQLVLLFLVDWGTLVAFKRSGAPARHVVGFVVVNVILLTATALVWRWLGTARAVARPNRPAA